MGPVDFAPVNVGTVGSGGGGVPDGIGIAGGGGGVKNGRREPFGTKGRGSSCEGDPGGNGGDIAGAAM